jgi:hypothetical protein
VSVHWELSVQVGRQMPSPVPRQPKIGLQLISPRHEQISLDAQPLQLSSHVPGAIVPASGAEVLSTQVQVPSQIWLAVQVLLQLLQSQAWVVALQVWFAGQQSDPQLAPVPAAQPVWHEP